MTLLGELFVRVLRETWVCGRKKFLKIIDVKEVSCNGVFVS